MLDFVNNYYEVTKENVSLLRQMIEDEDIRNPRNFRLDLDYALQVGHVLGNITNKNPKQTKYFDRNPKHTGLWLSKDEMNRFDMKKLTTKLPKVLMTIE